MEGFAIDRPYRIRATPHAIGPGRMIHQRAHSRAFDEGAISSMEIEDAASCRRAADGTNHAGFRFRSGLQAVVYRYEVVAFVLAGHTIGSRRTHLRADIGRYRHADDGRKPGERVRVTKGEAGRSTPR